MERKLSVKAIRVNLGMTQAEFVEELKKYGISLSVQSLCDKEQGKVEWKWNEIKAVSLIGGVHTQYIE